MIVYARINRIGWVHLWRSVRDFEEGEPSAHFFNSKVDPLWPEARLDEAQRAALAAGGLVSIEDPGYLDAEEGA